MTNNETEQFRDELQRAWDGDCWHGPPLKEVLNGITAETAAKKHPQLTHTIWGLVNHLAVWVEVVRLRIDRKEALLEPDQGNFPPVTDPSPAAWETAIKELGEQVDLLRDFLKALTPARLDETVAGKDYPVAVMLHGTAQHFAYHAGQIAFLKRLVG
ncbi:MAG TPA: DinB family protein [Gemmata sp.]